MPRRAQLIPWRTAGRVSEDQTSADDVVRQIGWVFNNETGDSLDLEEFTGTGDQEIFAYLTAFDLLSPEIGEQTLVEIGSGIGRMTAGFSKAFGQVIACDLDAAFLERCRQTVAKLGIVERLRTIHVADGRTLAIDDAEADLTFSYITLQHCDHNDALSLVGEAARVTKPGGHIALNFRTWTGIDVLLWPLGKITRALWRVPGFGPWLAKRRLASRLGWQANRLSPDQVSRYLDGLEEKFATRTIFHSPLRSMPQRSDAAMRTFDGVNASHWWLVAERL
ncbi:MAG: putative methyltransferase [Ilumatobacteraceae bacterium]|nr:putative methyltransferase [Ilumatobacteraceae bacterium]